MDLFDDPATATAVDLAALKGNLLLIKPNRVETGVSTVLGSKDATVADIHVIDGANPGEVLSEVFVWPKVLQAQLRPNVGTGRYCLGRLGQGNAKPGQNPPWKLADATDADKDAARRYLAELQITTPGTTNNNAVSNNNNSAAADDDDDPPWAKNRSSTQ